MGCRETETPQNFNVHFLYLEFPDVSRIPYTPEQYQRLLYSGDYNSILSHIHPNHANASHSSQPTQQTLYRSTPANRPVFGSVNEWFQYQSFGLMSVQGHFLGRFPSIHTYRELRQNHVAGLGEIIQAIMDEALAVIRQNRVTIAPGEKILVIHNAERFDTTVFAAGDLAFVNGRNFEGDDIVNIGEVTHELGHLLLYQPDRYGWNLGAMRLLDNMADSYSNFPTPYGSASRLHAGWASLENINNFEDRTINIYNNAYTPSYYALRARPTLDGTSTPTNTFIIERKDFIYRDNPTLRSLEELPHDGLVLNETAASFSFLKQHRLRISDRDGLPAAEYQTHILHTALEFMHRRDLATSREIIDRLIMPFSGTFNTNVFIDSFYRRLHPLNGFNCRNTASLNILGECVWSFETTQHDPTNVTSITAKAHAKAIDQRQLGNGVKEGNLLHQLFNQATAGRLYLRLRGTATLAHHNTVARLPHGTQTAPTTYVLNISKSNDDLKVQPTEAIDEAWLVERTGAIPTQLETPTTIEENNNTTWLTKSGTLSRNQHVLLKLERPQTGSPRAFIMLSQLRLLLKYQPNPATDTSTTTQSSQQTVALHQCNRSFNNNRHELEYDSAGRIRNCILLQEFNVSTTHTDPFVAQLPIEVFDTTLAGNNYEQLILVGGRNFSGSLDILSADYTPTHSFIYNGF